MAATGATPNSSVTAYAGAADMTAARSWAALADLLTDPANSSTTAVKVPNQAAVEALFSTTDAIGYRALRWASAQIEAAATAGMRYRPEDLQELTEQQVIPAAQGGNGTDTAYTVGRDLLVGLCCDLAFWYLVKRRKPGARPDDVAGVPEAFELLDRLRTGDRVFPIGSTQDAGLPDVAALDAETNVLQAAEPISFLASRFFGTRNR